MMWFRCIEGKQEKSGFWHLIKTLTFGLVSWAIAVAAFAAAILWNTNLLAEVVWGLIVFWLFGSIVPATLEDIGEFLAEYLHFYGTAKAFLLASHILYQLPLFGNKETRALAAEALSRITLLQDNKDDAVIWLDRALKIEGVSWTTRFQVLSAAGKVYFTLGKDDIAEKYFNDAWNMFGSKNEGFSPLSQQLSERQYASSLDLLALIKIKARRYDEAEQLFKRSARLRTQTKSLSDSASAYTENTCGIVEFLKGNFSDAEARFCCCARVADETPARPA